MRQYAKVSLDKELMEKGWCSLVPQLLESTEHDYREKVREMLRLSIDSVQLQCYRNSFHLTVSEMIS